MGCISVCIVTSNFSVVSPFLFTTSFAASVYSFKARRTTDDPKEHSFKWDTMAIFVFIKTIYPVTQCPHL